LKALNTLWQRWFMHALASSSLVHFCPGDLKKLLEKIIISISETYCEMMDEASSLSWAPSELAYLEDKQTTLFFHALLPWTMA